MIKFRFLILLVLTSLLVACVKPDSVINTPVIDTSDPGEFIDEWAYRIFPKEGSNFDVAEFRLWVPDSTDVSALKSILILASSYNSNGLGISQSDKWQAFAIEHKLALVSVHFKSYNAASIYETYTNANDGSGAALLTAVKFICQKQEMEALTELPFLLRGYSAGGMFSFSFSVFRPDRVIAFADIRGWGISSPQDENKDIPGLLLIAENDHPASNLAMKNIVEANRDKDGLWSYAIEPDVDHFGGLEASDELIKRFFSSALSKRLSTQTDELVILASSSGWLGDNKSIEIYSHDDFPGDKKKASWLIDEKFAIMWQEYQGK